MSAEVHEYSEEELETAAGESVYGRTLQRCFVGPHLQYTHGAWHEQSCGKVFAHKLDALIYLERILVDRASRENADQEHARIELGRVRDAIQRIRADGCDRHVPSLMNVLGEDNSLGLEYGGYWSEFVESSQHHWYGWGAHYLEMRCSTIYYEHRGTDVDVPSLIESDADMDYVEFHLMEGEVPADISDPDFVDLLLLIAPL